MKFGVFKMNAYIEMDYEIEATCDMDGEFPLHCAALLFDLLNLKENIVIKNQYTIKAEKENIIRQYRDHPQNCYYEWPKCPEGDYCVWIKGGFPSNQELIDLLCLQGIYLSYIAPTDAFDWEAFLNKWREKEDYLLLIGQASFICNVIDMDRTLNLKFSTAQYSSARIAEIMTAWEKEIAQIAQAACVQRMTVQRRGNKQLVRLTLQ